jgi:ribonuclease D
LAVLRELAILREQMAFEHDLPARVMMKDEVLMDMATRGPETDAGLLAIKNIAREEVASYGDQMIAAVKRGKAIPPELRPTMQGPIEDSTETKRLAEIMFAASQVICLGQSVSPGLVTSQAEILSLARLVEKNAEDEKHPLMHGWARECLGEPLVKFVRGGMTIDLRVTPERMMSEFKPVE